MTFRQRAWAIAVVLVVTGGLPGCAPNQLLVAQEGLEQSCTADGLCVRRALQLSAGLAYACAVLSGGTLKCWGDNYAGNLGLGNASNRLPDIGPTGEHLPAVDVGAGRRVVSVAAGGQSIAPDGKQDSHTCAILDTGQLKCWGQNGFGALGLGDLENRGDQPGEMGDLLPAVDLGTGRTALAVAVSDWHTCVLLDNHQIKCFGDNRDGQLGLGDTQTRGDQLNEMGDFLPAIDLGPGRTATAVTTGGSHTCALLDNGQLKCWGNNTCGQLGLNDNVIRGNQPGQMGAALPAIDLGTGRKAVKVLASGDKSCAVLDNGQVKCWGNNSYGQLGLGDSDDRGDQPGEMGDALPAVDLGRGRTALGLAGAVNSACALLDTHQVKCWGDNSHGDLGIGDSAHRGDEPGEMGDLLPAVNLGAGVNVSSIARGALASCALLETGLVKCWGIDVTPGAFGTDVGEVPGDLGDALPIVDFGL